MLGIDMAVVLSSTKRRWNFSYKFWIYFSYKKIECIRNPVTPSAALKHQISKKIADICVEETFIGLFFPASFLKCLTPQVRCLSFWFLIKSVEFCGTAGGFPNDSWSNVICLSVYPSLPTIIKCVYLYQIHDGVSRGSTFNVLLVILKIVKMAKIWPKRAIEFQKKLKFQNPVLYVPRYSWKLTLKAKMGLLESTSAEYFWK